MKKIFLTTIAAISLIAGSTFAINPASAASFPVDGDVYYTVGDTVNLDLGCREAGIYTVYFDTGLLPDGLTLSMSGQVTGTPTTVGDYQVSGYHCFYSAGGVGSMYYSLTFHINPMVTPTPVVIAHNLNVETCDIYAAIVFPETPDLYSTFLRFENQDGSVTTYTFGMSGQLASDFLYEMDWNISDLNYHANNFGLTGNYVGSEPFKCGDTFSVTGGYQYRGAPVGATTVSNVVVEKPVGQPTVLTGSTPLLKTFTNYGSPCEFRVIGSLNSPAQAGTTKLSIEVPDKVVHTLTIDDAAATGTLDFTFDANNLDFNQAGISGHTFTLGNNFSDFGCGTTFNIKLEYVDLVGTKYSESATVTAPQYPEQAPTPLIVNAYRSPVGLCSIKVVAQVPDEVRPIDLSITHLDSDERLVSMHITGGTTPDGDITATLSMQELNDFEANVPIESKSIDVYDGCSGKYRVVIGSPVGILGFTIVDLNQQTIICNAGSVINFERTACYLNGLGNYTTEINSEHGIQCPAGMTTYTFGSKSINDCYKPIVQSIVGLKAPKALKFKASINLAITTNTKALAWFRVVGPCKAKLVNVVTKVKGKKVTTKMLKVTAGTKAGICLIDLTAPTSGKYLNLKKVVQIKVSKTGK